jgi:DNA topoisomerase-2
MSTHIYKYAPLEVVGQVGSLRVPKCDTAPRYLTVRKSPYLDFFKTDLELTEKLIDDGDLIEPRYFLPIIPIVLLWRTNSPGFGFSFRSFSYGLDSIIDNCIKAITVGSCNTDINEIQIIPVVEGIKQENMIYNANKNSWYNVGEYTMDFNNDQLIVSDLPYDVSFEKYDAHLHTLIEKNYITGFSDVSMDGRIRYIIQFSRGRLKILSAEKWKFFQTMKLYSKVIKDTLNCMDLDGKNILFFNNPYELIDTFVKKRLGFYAKRKIRTLEIIKQDIIELSYKIKFIQMVTDEQIIINKRPIVDIKLDLDKAEIPYDVLKLNIERLTKEEIEKMISKREELHNYLDYIKVTPVEEMYISDLVEFKSKYLSIKTK